MNFLQLVFRLLLLLPLLHDDVASGIRICKSLRLSSKGYETHRNVSRLQADLTAFVAGCQYVFGDVILSNIGINQSTYEPLDDEIRGMQTDFLDSIVEIRGKIRILHVSLERVTFRNLRTIRMHHFAFEKFNWFTFLIFKSPNMSKLELPKLTAITGRNVSLFGEQMQSSLYCYLFYSINWTSLLQEPGQRFLDEVISVITEQGQVLQRSSNSRVIDRRTCSRQISCHANCTQTPIYGQKCWSDGVDGCQSNHLCRKRKCNTTNLCFHNPNTGQEDCCDDDCLGGCSNRPNECFACRRGVLFNGVCRESCPSNTSTASGNGTGVTVWRQIGNICVEKCSLPFVVSSDGRRCLIECPSAEVLIKGVCRKCIDKIGSKPCKSCNVPDLMTDNLAYSLRTEQCSIWRADSTLYVSAKNLSSLDISRAFENLEYFYGNLIILGSQNLTVNLRSLRNIKRATNSLIIMSLNTRYLGLASLEYTPDLVLMDISDICRAWYPSNRIREIKNVTKEFQITIENLSFDDSSEICRNATCDAQCQDECWGPGPDMCVACRNFKVNGRCYATCAESGRIEVNGNCELPVPQIIG